MYRSDPIVFEDNNMLITKISEYVDIELIKTSININLN